ncbi:alcohol dehydrogenase [Penicillium paradoxum]|uniref:alcohol dehydrogenase n=1 Tax=Penicillium paradoxum TaxID=176176 RepID=UPI0025486C3F|nr:alcohol dehydrogenase [Penicillium paradoxum]KAJ5773455.1 alcohol dehydrogenase [Penicillium paradoxum]
MARPPGDNGPVYYSLVQRTTPIPPLDVNQTLVKISAAALNHRDHFLRQNLYPGTALGVPILGDGSGVVVDIGSQVPAHWKHKRVMIYPGSGWLSSPKGPEDGGYLNILGGTVYNPQGTLAEYMVVDWKDLEETPGHLTDVQAAALPIAGLTAWRALCTKGGVTGNCAGKQVLITGIGGGVALMLLAFAVAQGADVWVTTSKEEKLKEAVRLGAKGGVNYREDKWDAQLLELLPPQHKHFDVIVDGAGGDIVDRGVRLLSSGGVISIYGMTLSPKMPFTMKAVLKNIDVRGSTMGSRREFGEMVEFVRRKGVTPIVHRVVDGIDNMEGIEELFGMLESGAQFGKLVIRIANPDKGKL